MTQLNQRRRGNRLENAIYDTTYTLLSQYGLDQVTFSRVATAAATSRSVLYRYWDSTFDLIFHTIIHQMANYKFNPNKPGIFQWQSVDD
ncbi:TetR family transcriptional regulator, partial [Lactiplantibacillus plantarum]